jgi:signal transduction histidine kinase
MLTFDFVGLCYSDPEKTQYAYTLEGLSGDWMNCGTRRTATFTNLDPGFYVFRVKAGNADGVWHEEGASLKLVIDPPFWQTWWFRSLGLIVLGLALYGSYRYRVSRILAMERLRLRIANDLHDDIGSELSSIALESDLLARRFSTSDPAHERLRTVGRTIRTAADNLRDVVWIVSPDQDSIQDLVERMREVAGKMLSGISFSFSEKREGAPAPLEMEFKRHVLMMYKEILHNVVSHAQAANVVIDFTMKDNHMRLCVQDNGVGFDASQPHSGRGLRSLHARASAIGGKITIESVPASGTTVYIDADITRL